MQIGNATILHIDCLEYMATLPDKSFDLCIVDPPYGINAGNMTLGKRVIKLEKKNWDIDAPDTGYFKALERVAQRQIIFGGNYFPLPLTGGWIFWDKDKGKDTSFSDGELAWTNFLNTLKKAVIRYDGFIGMEEPRIHPTQKPVKLYEWLLANYANPGDKILDTHLGSGSSAIAANNLGFEFVGCELDKDYYDAACKRIEHHNKQLRLFA